MWTEPGVSGFRARVMARTDLDSDIETTVTVADRDELVAAVRDWLDRFLDVPSRSSPLEP